MNLEVDEVPGSNCGRPPCVLGDPWRCRLGMLRDKPIHDLHSLIHLTGILVISTGFGVLLLVRILLYTFVPSIVI